MRDISKKIIFASIGFILLAVLSISIYRFTRKTPEPVAVTADPVEREREEQRGEELAAFEENNKVNSLLKDHSDVTYQYISYDEDGCELFNILIVVTNEDVMYMDGTGHTEYLFGGKWVGFDPDTNSVYTMVCVDTDTYTAEWEYLRDSASFYFDTLTVTDDIKTKGEYTTVTRSAKISEDNIALFQNTWPTLDIGDKFLDVYTFADGIFVSENYSAVKEDGTEIVLGRVLMTLDSGVTMDEGILDAALSEEQRTLTLGIDAGTDESSTLIVKTGIGTEFLFALPEEYENVYMDKECTVLLESQDMEDDLEAYIYKSK